MNRVLITGASSGIGREFATQFHERGHSVLLVARRKDLLKELTDELNSIRPDTATYLCADLVCDEDVHGCLGIVSLLEKLQDIEIDILVNNAGRGSFGYFDSLDSDVEIKQVELNILATMKLAHSIIPQMKVRKRGAIISISSIAAFQPLPLMATYAATKAFNFYHSIALREELMEFGIRVLTVCPGPTATEFGGVARVPGTATGGPRDDVTGVVRLSLAAFDKNKAYVVPGLRANLMAQVSKFLPFPVSSRLVANSLKKVLKRSQVLTKN